MTREQRIKELVASAPPLTPEQLQRLSLLLSVSHNISGMRRELRQATKGAGNE